MAEIKVGGKKTGPGSELVLDCREHGLIKLIPDVATRGLDLGDAIIVVGEQIEYVIERKTAADFAASIEDGRYREQKHRLLSHFRPDQIMYLVEGYYAWQVRNKEMDRRVSAAIAHSIIRDRILIYHVPDMQTLAEFIVRLNRDWAEHRDAEKAEYVSTKGVLSKKRRENSTPERVYTAMLTCIGGISQTTATALAQSFPNFRKLLAADLSNFKIKNRKISSTAVTNINLILG